MSGPALVQSNGLWSFTISFPESYLRKMRPDLLDGDDTRSSPSVSRSNSTTSLELTAAQSIQIQNLGTSDPHGNAQGQGQGKNTNVKKELFAVASRALCAKWIKALQVQYTLLLNTRYDATHSSVLV